MGFKLKGWSGYMSLRGGAKSKNIFGEGTVGIKKRTKSGIGVNVGIGGGGGYSFKHRIGGGGVSPHVGISIPIGKKKRG